MTTETRAPRIDWCHLCRRATPFEDYDSRIVTLWDGSAGVICGHCIEQSDVTVPLDMMDYEGDDDGD